MDISRFLEKRHRDDDHHLDNTVEDEEPSTKKYKVKTNAVELLLLHPLTSEISLDDVMFVWKNSKDGTIRHLEGITKTLKACFYPDYKAATNNRSTSSKNVGSKVHRQIYHMVECIEKRGGNCTCNGTKIYKNRLHRWTKQALNELAKLNITLVACEVPILCKRAERCTAIDAVGLMWKGTDKEKSVHISFKTGYKVGYDVNTLGQFMQPPFANIVSTPKNHNELQLWMEKMILDIEYGITFDMHIIMYLGHGDNDEALIEYLGNNLITTGEDARNAYDIYCTYCIKLKHDV